MGIIDGIQIGRTTLRWQRLYARRLFLTDLATVLISVFGSQLLWFGRGTAELHIPLEGVRDFAIGYTLISLTLVVLWIVALDFYATRDHKIIGSGSTEYKRMVDATIRLFGVMAIIMFLFKSGLGRGYFLTALPLGLLLLLIGRWAWRQWLVSRRRDGRYVHRVLILGERAKSEHVATSIGRDSAAGLHLVGALTRHGRVAKDLVPGVPVLGDFNDVSRIIDEFDVDTLIFTGADELGPRKMRELGWELEALSVSLIVAPALTDVAGPRIHARPIAGLPLIQVDYPTFEGTKHWAKRAFDVVAASLALLLLSPIFLWIAIAVRRDNEGPAFFRQQRVGLNGEGFRMIKFRSMVTDAEAQLPSLLDQSDGNGVLFKLKSDPRITKVGALLRRYSLDELPQLINVLRGDMSLVGPRPPLANEVEEYDRWAERRLLVKPGITGLWQVSGRSDLSWEDSVRLDLYYVENWSLTGDVIILYRTIRAILRPSGAY